MSQFEESDDEDTLVWIGPTAANEGESDEGFEEEVTTEFVLPDSRPDLPDLPAGSDRDTLVSASPFQGPPPLEVEHLEPVFDPTIPDPPGHDSSRDTGIPDR